MALVTALDRLAALPRAELGGWPTPLHLAERFSEAVGVEVWLKRDDVQSVALAGNKLRKFELVLGQAVADGATTLVTTGAAQSNSARTGAAAATRLGLDTVLLLSGERPDDVGGNLLLDRMLGVDVRFCGDVTWRELNALVEAVGDEVAAGGGMAVAAPIGCSSPLGSLGFAVARLELDAQLDALGLTPTAIVHTSTSGGTHAGFLVGEELSPRSIPTIAVNVGHVLDDPSSDMATLATAAGSLIGLDRAWLADEIEVLDGVGPGYGRHTDEGAEAIALLARTEAIICDPVYSGKGLAGFLAAVRRGEITGPVVFWHTGGFHAVFDRHHGDQLLERLPDV